MVTTLSPRLVTRGQKTKSSHEIKIRPRMEGARIGVDWVQNTFHPKDSVIEDTFGAVEPYRMLAAVQCELSEILGCDPADWQELDAGHNGYMRARLGPRGARIDYEPVGRIDFNVTLPGKACALAGEVGLRRWMLFSLMHGGESATRIDVDIDDYDKAVSPGQVVIALQGPDAVTHADKGLVQIGFKVRSNEVTGATTYLGAASSRQRMRVYDKELESKGQVPCIRWELTCRKEAAQTLMQQLAHMDWNRVIPDRLVSFIDFREHSSSSKIELRQRCEWFHALVRHAEKAEVYLEGVPKTVHNVLAWLELSIGPSLAMARQYWGKTYRGPLKDLMDKGQSNWKPRHTKLLQDAGVSLGALA